MKIFDKVKKMLEKLENIKPKQEDNVKKEETDRDNRDENKIAQNQRSSIFLDISQRIGEILSIKKHIPKESINGDTPQIRQLSPGNYLVLDSTDFSILVYNIDTETPGTIMFNDDVLYKKEVFSEPSSTVDLMIEGFLYYLNVLENIDDKSDGMKTAIAEAKEKISLLVNLRKKIPDKIFIVDHITNPQEQTKDT